MKTASEALLEVAHDPTFFIDTDKGQKEKVRKITIRSSLKAKVSCFDAAERINILDI
jgi:hypothetical protein